MNVASEIFISKNPQEQIVTKYTSEITLAYIHPKEVARIFLFKLFLENKRLSPILSYYLSDLANNKAYNTNIMNFRQLTLIEHELFKGIQSHECLKQKWLKDSKG